MSKEMKRSYLIQRLMAPRDGSSKIDKALNCLAFGGGLKNGGLSDEAADMLRSIFRFDYMGASEFEWGAVPEALSKIHNDKKEYKSYELPVSLVKDGKTYRESVYIICKKEWLEEIKKRICAWKDGYANRQPEFFTKEAVNLDQSIHKKYFNGEEMKESRITKGWLELDNGYFFFIDQEMFNKTKELFGVK